MRTVDSFTRPKCTGITRWTQDILNGNFIAFFVGCSCREVQALYGGVVLVLMDMH